MCLLITYYDSKFLKFHPVYLLLSNIIWKNSNILGNSVSLGERGEAFAGTYSHIWPDFQALSDEHQGPCCVGPGLQGLLLQLGAARFLLSWPAEKQCLCS